MSIVSVSLSEFNDVVKAIKSGSSYSSKVGMWEDNGDDFATGVFEKPTNNVDKYRIEIKEVNNQFILTVEETEKDKDDGKDKLGMLAIFAVLGAILGYNILGGIGLILGPIAAIVFIASITG